MKAVWLTSTARTMASVTTLRKRARTSSVSLQLTRKANAESVTTVTRTRKNVLKLIKSIVIKRGLVMLRGLKSMFWLIRN